MTTIREMAAEFNMQPYELIAFAGDAFAGLAETEEIPADSEAFVREALARSPISE